MNKYGNATQFSKWLGVSQPYTAQLKKAGKLVYAPDGKRIDFEASKQRIALFADVGRANNGLNAKPKRQPANDDVCLDDVELEYLPDIGEIAEVDLLDDAELEKLSPAEIQHLRNLARLKTEQHIANQEEMKAAQMAGVLGNKETMTRAVFTAFRALRDNINTLGARIAPKCQGKSEREIQALIDDELFLIFQSFEEQTIPALTAVKY